MPYAILNPDGTIREVVPKLLPDTGTPFGARPGLPDGQLIVDYNPPAHDPVLQTCTPVQPVPQGQAAVSFVVADKPDALATLKARKWEEIKAAREAAEFGGFVWAGSAFDSDDVSQRRLQGAVQLAGLLPTFAVDWTLADNSTRTLSAADLQAVGVALGQHVQACHAQARSRRAQILAAGTAAQVALIGW